MGLLATKERAQVSRKEVIRTFLFRRWKRAVCSQLVPLHRSIALFDRKHAIDRHAQDESDHSGLVLLKVSTDALTESIEIYLNLESS